MPLSARIEERVKAHKYGSTERSEQKSAVDWLTLSRWRQAEENSRSVKSKQALLNVLYDGGNPITGQASFYQKNT